jgi:hypothetical protein
LTLRVPVIHALWHDANGVAGRDESGRDAGDLGSRIDTP